MATGETRALVLASGGVDSSTLLALKVAELGTDNVVALSISYGQRHEREIRSARDITRHYGVEQHFCDLSTIFEESDCSLLAHSHQDVPAASYAEQLDETGGMPVSTYVPFRNGLFLSAAAAIALENGCSEVCYGAHHDDWAGNAYPDCSETFVHAMDAAIREGTGGLLHLVAPFVRWSKADIVRTGLEIGVPYELTWSCYNGDERPCGTCGTCIDRARAFELCGARDPLLDACEQ
jgi:7-cyano-7-deazaguanine synthase